MVFPCLPLNGYSIVLIIIIFILIYYYLYVFTYWSKQGIQYLKPFPIVGNFLPVISTLYHPGQFFGDCYAKVKDPSPFIGIYILHTPYLIIKDFDLIKSILIKDFNHFENRTINNDMYHDKIGTSTLFFIRNPIWKALRSKITPFFSTGNIKHLFPLIKHVSDEFVSYVNNIVEESKGESIEIREACLKYSTDVIASCSFGIEANSLKNDKSPFREIGRAHFNTKLLRCFEVISFFFVPLFVNLFRLNLFNRNCANFLKKLFTDVARERQDVTKSYANKKYSDYMDLLINLNDKELKFDNSDQSFKLDLNIIISQVGTFFQAGFESAATAISFLVYHLSLNNEIQMKLRNEIQKVLLENDGKITYESISEMRYLDRCLEEVLRMYPTLPFLDRMCTKKYHVPNTNYIIEKGQKIIVPVYGVHMDPNLFPEPKKFNPERFDDIKQLSSILSFGEGPRKCIGQRFGKIQSKMGIISLLSEFEIVRANDTEVPIKLTSKAIVMCPTNGIRVKLRKSRLINFCNK